MPNKFNMYIWNKLNFVNDFNTIQLYFLHFVMNGHNLICENKNAQQLKVAYFL